MKERHKAVPAVYLILEKDGKYLWVRRWNTGYQDGNYNLPSGHVEANELPTMAMIREAKEEIGIDLKPEDLEFVHVSCRPDFDGSGDRIDMFFRARTWSGEVINAEPHKCDDLRWLHRAEFPENITPHVRSAFDDMLNGIFFSERSLAYMTSNPLYVKPGA
jgi:8-oxo-dGTP pyrophosphatase MutT (NUDIX family)